MVLQNKIKVGIRNSALSIAQTKEFTSLASKKIDELQECDFEIQYIETTGDIKNQQRLDQIGGKGLFIKEIEEHLINGEVDIGVHSMKDMPAVDHDHLEVICFMKRLDNSDVLISNSGKTLDELESGSTVGTSSIRRRAQLLSYRKDLRIKLLRGNVDTRLRKLKDNEYDAIILAYAGMKRLNLDQDVTEQLDQNIFLPAAGQGIVGIQSKKNSKLKKLFHNINDSETRIIHLAEKNFLMSIKADCNSPVGVHAKVEQENIFITAKIYSHQGEVLFNKTVVDAIKDHENVGLRLGKEAVSKLGQNRIDELNYLPNDFNYTP